MREALAAVIMATAAVLSGCSASSPESHRPVIASHKPTPRHRSAIVSPPLAPRGSAPGRLILLKQGWGPKSIRVALPPTHQSSLTVRFWCRGSGPVAIRDQRRVLLRINGVKCSINAVYSAAFRGNRADRRIQVSAMPSTVWRLGVWIHSAVAT